MIAVTERPRLWRLRPMLEVVIPFPRPDKTPPVTMTYFIIPTGKLQRREAI